jgi:hypothetical protein
MTATNPGEPPRLPRPACTPAAIRTVLAANADPDTLGRYDADLDAAFEQSRTGGDLTPLLDTVHRLGGGCSRSDVCATSPRHACCAMDLVHDPLSDRAPPSSSSSILWGNRVRASRIMARSACVMLPGEVGESSVHNGSDGGTVAGIVPPTV